MTLNRLIRNGKVAVLASPGFGAGWSTWNTEYPEILFDPVIVDLVERGRGDWFDQVKVHCELKYPDAYLGGGGNLVVEWVPQGTLFRVVEYDGNETVEICDDIDWLVA